MSKFFDIFYNLNFCTKVVVGSTDEEGNMKSEIKTKLLRRSSQECCYIIDPIPTFSDEHKTLVVESWHFITDHISEVTRLSLFYYC